MQDNGTPIDGKRRALPTGIRERHSRTCAANDGGTCKPCKSKTCTGRCGKCHPFFEASVFVARDGKKKRKACATLAEAKLWRADNTTAAHKGTLRATSSSTLREASEAWLNGAKAGSIRTRSGQPFKPSTVQAYESALNLRVLDELGGRKLGDVRRVDVQDFADRLLGEGLDPSTVRNMIAPLRVIFRRAVSRGEIGTNPTSGLELAAPQGQRDRIEPPEQAAKLIAALPAKDRALWATAFYAGLRLGELLALRWEDIDLKTNILRVNRSYDPKAAMFVNPKSKAGTRNVPVAAELRAHLLAHQLATGRRAGLVFGATAERPFTPSNARRRAETAWKKAKLAPIGLHEARHCFASFMIAAGINAKTLSEYMGHAAIGITFDRYGHLMPGNEDAAAALLDGYLARELAKAKKTR